MSGHEPTAAEATPRGKYYLSPTPCQQVQQSRRLILAAAEARGGAVLVLGAGRCAEIPLAELAVQFERVTINDINAAELEQGIAAAHLDEAARAKLDVRVGDLTNATDRLLDKIDGVLDESGEADAAIEAMAQLLDDEPLAGMPLEGKYDLIVASCVLSQLHFRLLHSASEAFERRFPGAAERLATNVRWTSALYDMARRMEARFIDDLIAHLAEHGLIYLSDSPQLCYIKLTPDGKWETEGTYRLLRSKELGDYLDRRFAVIAQGRWHWIVSPPEKPGDEGRLFDVQAVVLRVWRTSSA